MTFRLEMNKKTRSAGREKQRISVYTKELSGGGESAEGKKGKKR